MACLNKANSNNFLVWNKVSGGLTLSKLQSGGLPIACDNINGGWSLSTTTFLRSFDISAQQEFITGVFISDDGTRLFIIGIEVDKVSSYILTIPYNISTASFESIFSTSAQDSLCSGLFFKADGLKMYHSGTTNDNIYQYSLSSAWDISTLSYEKAFSVSSEDGNCRDVFFKTDGSIMYTIGYENDKVYQYNLSASWDIATASLDKSLDISAKNSAPTGLFFKSDGTKLYTLDAASDDKVHEYILSTAWDISSALFNYSITVVSQDGAMNGMCFGKDGFKMYLAGNVNDTISEYDLTN